MGTVPLLGLTENPVTSHRDDYHDDLWLPYRVESLLLPLGRCFYVRSTGFLITPLASDMRK